MSDILNLIFVLITVVAANDESPATDCSTWPPNLMPIKECCNIPIHLHKEFQSYCVNKVLSKEDESMMACYLNKTGILKDGIINKAAVKKIYIKNISGERKWLKVINDSVEKCHYDAQSSTTENLIKFHNCIDELLAENCPNFIQTEGCAATEEHFNDCNKSQLNCSSWPVDLVFPHACCKTPVIISEELTIRCRQNCSRKEFFTQNQMDCIKNCTYFDNGLIVNGKVEFEAAKKMLLKNSNKSEIWEKTIDTAVDACVRVIKGDGIQKKLRC